MFTKKTMRQIDSGLSSGGTALFSINGETMLISRAHPKDATFNVVSHPQTAVSHPKMTSFRSGKNMLA